MHGRVLGQFVGDEDAHSVALDRLDGRSRRLAVIAPELRGHARRDLALNFLGDEMELLPFAVHAEGQSPSVQSHDRCVGLAIGGRKRRLHRRRGVGRRLGDGRQRGVAAHRSGAGKRHGRSGEEVSSRQHGSDPFSHSLAAFAAMSVLSTELKLPPPSTAELRLVAASQKFRFASMLATFAASLARAASSNAKASTCMALYCSSVCSEMVLRSGSTSRSYLIAMARVDA